MIWVQAVMKSDAVAGIDKFVLATIASWAAQDGTCFPSQQEITHRSGLSDRTVRRSIDALKQRGLIEVSTGSGRGRKTVYRITEKVVTQSTITPEKVVRETTFIDQKVVTQSKKGGHTVQKSRPTPLYEQTKEQTNNGGGGNTRTRAGKTEVPPHWTPTPEEIDFAKEKGISDELIPSQVETFIRHHRAAGTLFADVGEGWKLWCHRFRPELHGNANGRGRANGNGRYIEARDNVGDWSDVERERQVMRELGIPEV